MKLIDADGRCPCGTLPHQGCRSCGFPRVSWPPRPTPIVGIGGRPKSGTWRDPRARLLASSLPRPGAGWSVRRGCRRSRRMRRIEAVARHLFAEAPVNSVHVLTVSPVDLHCAADEVFLGRRPRCEQLIALTQSQCFDSSCSMVSVRRANVRPPGGVSGVDHGEQIRGANRPIEKIDERLPRVARAVPRRVKSVEVDDEQPVARIGRLTCAVATLVGSRRSESNGLEVKVMSSNV